MDTLRELVKLICSLQHHMQQPSFRFHDTAFDQLVIPTVQHHNYINNQYILQVMYENKSSSKRKRISKLGYHSL